MKGSEDIKPIPENLVMGNKYNKQLPSQVSLNIY